MTAEEITLNIAVNLGRIGRWAMEGKESRVKQFLTETESYLQKLEQAPKRERFLKTFDLFKVKFGLLRSNIALDKIWAEDVLTWANILTHRAKFA